MTEEKTQKAGEGFIEEVGRPDSRNSVTSEGLGETEHRRTTRIQES